MSLQMKGACEKCAAVLSPHDEAVICSYECTFCTNCSEELKSICPHCGGELQARPRRRQAPERAHAR